MDAPKGMIRKAVLLAMMVVVGGSTLAGLTVAGSTLSAGAPGTVFWRWFRERGTAMAIRWDHGQRCFFFSFPICVDIARLTWDEKRGGGDGGGEGEDSHFARPVLGMVFREA